jgi:hypothetical protein
MPKYEYQVYPPKLGTLTNGRSQNTNLQSSLLFLPWLIVLSILYRGINCAKIVFITKT